MRQSLTLLRASRIFTRIAPTAAVIFLLAIADIFISGHMESKVVFRALPGSSLAVAGELAFPARTVEKLAYTVPSCRIHLHFTATQGKLWRGRLDVDANTDPGEYALRIFVGSHPPAEALRLYRIQVFADQPGLNASYKSLARRYLGIAPLWIAVAAFVLVLPGLAGSFYLSHHQEQYLASQGIVPIAKMARAKHGWEIQFALGQRQGVQPQDTLLLLDAQFAPVGRIMVERVQANHSSAVVPFNVPICPTCWLAKAQE